MRRLGSVGWKEEPESDEDDEDWPAPPADDNRQGGAQLLDADYYSILGLDRDLIEELDKLSQLTHANNFVKAAYRKSLVEYSEKKISSLEDEGESDNEDGQADRDQRTTTKVHIDNAFHQLSTWKQRQLYKEQKSPLSAPSVRSRYLDVSTEEFEMAFAQLILQNFGQVAAGSTRYKEFIKRSGYLEKMKSLGNPKKFCLERTQRGFRFVKGRTSLGDLFAFTPPQGSCIEWMNGYCSNRVWLFIQTRDRQTLPDTRS
jgi:hypothetical protein